MWWLIFRVNLWVMARRVEQYHHWGDAVLRDRLDDAPCRDCDIPEGMWW
jgi:hypothetical protein